MSALRVRLGPEDRDAEGVPAVQAVPGQAAPEGVLTVPQEVAHDYEAARRFYSELATSDLHGVAKALVHDAKGNLHQPTTYFAIERLGLIVEILAEREQKTKQKARRFELALEKRPPEVKITEVQR